MKHLQVYLIIGMLFSLTSCATTKLPINTQEKPNIASVSINIKAPIKIFSSMATALYFAKIENNGELNKDYLIRSNYYQYPSVYLLNKQPGEYAIVGALYYRQGHSYTCYLTAESINKTKFKLADGEFTFIGDVTMESTTNLDNLDSSQITYSNLISPGGIGLGVFSGEHHYSCNITELNNDISTKKEFFKNAQTDLAGGNWGSVTLNN